VLSQKTDFKASKTSMPCVIGSRLNQTVCSLSKLDIFLAMLLTQIKSAWIWITILTLDFDVCGDSNINCIWLVLMVNEE
jgi:hypothetical protein